MSMLMKTVVSLLPKGSEREWGNVRKVHPDV